MNLEPKRALFIVSPVYNERENIPHLLEALHEHCGNLPYQLRIILVDDGSSADTAELLDTVALTDPSVLVLHLSRNFGHQAALSAGMEEAFRLGADAMLTLDSDLQHPPRLIPDLVRRWEEGFQVVFTIRDDQVRTRFFKRVSASGFYWLLDKLSDRKILRGAADFRLLDRTALEALVALPERARFIRGLTAWIGFRQVGVPYVPDPRFAGQSKYSLRRMIHLALDGLVSTTTLPLRVVILFGLLLSLLALSYLFYIVWAYFATHRAVPGWSSVMASVLLMGGAHLTVLGVLGIYLAKIYDEVKGRPPFIVKNRVGNHEPALRAF